MDLDNLHDDEDEAVGDTLFKSIRGFMIFGKLIGLLPYKGVFSNSSINLKFSWLSIYSLISLVIILLVTFNTILEFSLSASSSRKNAFEIAQSIRITFYYIWGTIIYINFLVRANTFLNIFKAWRSCVVFFTKPDIHLKRDTIIICVMILVSAVLENALLYVNYIYEAFFPKNGDAEAMSNTMKKYYANWHTSWARHISYHPVIPIIAFLQHKCVMFCWNYMDILIAILGRALYFKFKALFESAQEHLVKPALIEKSIFTGKPKSIQIDDKIILYEQGWYQLTKDYHAIYELMKSFESFLSPLIFISYTVNIYYICMQVLDSLMRANETNVSWIDAIYRPWSFLHLTMRIYVVSICCARVNVYAHKIRDITQECPASSYDSHISRLDKRLSSGREIGLSGLGCFTVTKPFILSVIGVIFTFEIVLVQVIPNAEPEEQNCLCVK